MRTRHRSPRRALLVAAYVGLVGALGACGGDPPPSPPAGVDELTIPTPSPDPGDYVDTVANPWLALEPGATTTLRGTAGELVVEVLEEPTEVAGVSTTVVRTTTDEDPDDDEPGAQVTDFLAEDRDGNVWWLGRDGVWEAGQGGAEAGLLVPETPRLGDGYRLALLPGVVEDRAQVVGLVDDVLELLLVDPLVSGSTRVATYELGTGLVRVEGTGGVLERVSDPV